MATPNFAGFTHNPAIAKSGKTDVAIKVSTSPNGVKSNILGKYVNDYYSPENSYNIPICLKGLTTKPFVDISVIAAMVSVSKDDKDLELTYFLIHGLRPLKNGKSDYAGLSGPEFDSRKDQIKNMQVTANMGTLANMGVDIDNFDKTTYENICKMVTPEEPQPQEEAPAQPQEETPPEPKKKVNNNQAIKAIVKSQNKMLEALTKQLNKILEGFADTHQKWESSIRMVSNLIHLNRKKGQEFFRFEYKGKETVINYPTPLEHLMCLYSFRNDSEDKTWKEMKKFYKDNREWNMFQSLLDNVSKTMDLLDSVGINNIPSINDRFIIFCGEPGGGKSIAAEHYPNAKGSMGLNASMDASDLLKSFEFKEDGSPVFKPSIFRDTVENGGTVVFEEAQKLNSQTVGALQPLLDQTSHIEIGGEKINVSPDFKLIATMNMTDGGIRCALPDAMLDRCSVAIYFELTPKLIADRLQSPIQDTGFDNDKLNDILNQMEGMTVSDESNGIEGMDEEQND